MLEFWNANGGLPVFGLPISPQRAETTANGVFEAQWFERGRLELHPEAKAPYDVQLGRLGVDALVKQGRDWFTFPGATSSEIQAENCRFFGETEHTVCGEFLTAFRSYGLAFPGINGVGAEESLALFGLPISQPITESTPDGQQLLVQWFERARFELHPNNQAPYNVQFGRLGAEVFGPIAAPAPSVALVGTTWQLVASGPQDAPILPAASGEPARLRFGNDNQVTGSSGCNSFSGSYQDDGKQLTFGALLTTLVACAAPESQQESRLYAAFVGSRPYEQSGEQLKIFYDNNASALVYQALPTVTGTVSYRERIALGRDALVTVELLDVSRADAPAIVIARQVIPTDGKQVPFDFALAYDPTQIQPTATYAVRATIREGEQLLFTTNQSYQVITRGKPTEVDLVLVQA